MPKKYPIESLLSARHLLSPRLVDDYLYFMSNMSGVMSLYRMKKQGGLPEPLLPPGVALQNPHLMMGASYVVFPSLNKILVMIDNNGDENYQACLIPTEGGIPENAFGDKYLGQKLACMNNDEKGNIAYFYRDDRKTANIECIRLDLKKSKATSLGTSKYGNYCGGMSKDHSKIVLIDGYTAADDVLYLWKEKTGKKELLFGIPIESREEGKKYAPSGIGTCNFTNDGKGLVLKTTLTSDAGSLAFLRFEKPSTLEEISITGLKHRGTGELENIRTIEGNSYILQYNIDGSTWIYQGRLALDDSNKRHHRFTVERTIVGAKPVSNGVVLGFEPSIQNGKVKKNSFVFSFTTATNPSQLYIFDSSGKKGKYTLLSAERVLGIPDKLLSSGEDRSYTSFDDMHISARLYLPSKNLGLKPPFPLVLYVHGGPQGQERPDFTWFSMPLIQYLTLNGIAVFVPNVRGSTGYGLEYMKMVDHDWGGNDRLDLVEGLKFLEKNDPRIDSTRRGVIGRSYGGYMTLTLVSRHPDLFKAGVDMFGPYNLFTFIERLPETWRTYFYLAIGDPKKDKDFLTERSPSTYIDQVNCSMLMIQGKNDPRVVEKETRDVVERLKSRGVPVDYLVFEDEGHDVIKFKNRVTCYAKIASFFSDKLA
ncbi:MAG: alpha/beta hydrolase family protein [Nitrososphaerales archaeon]